MTSMFLFVAKMFSCLFPLKEFSPLSIPFPPSNISFIPLSFLYLVVLRVINSTWDHLETKVSMSSIIKICIYQNLKKLNGMFNRIKEHLFFE